MSLLGEVGGAVEAVVNWVAEAVVGGAVDAVVGVLVVVGETVELEAVLMTVEEKIDSLIRDTTSQ